MNKLKAVKHAATIVISLGVGAVVQNLVKSTTPLNPKLISKILVGVGSLSVATVLGDLAADSAVNAIDKTVVDIAEAKAEIRRQTEESA